MTQTLSREDLRHSNAIDAAIAAHGAWRVLIAAAAALMRGRMRKARPPDARHLDDHIRADIGLPPRAPAPDWLAHGPAAFRPR